MAETIANATITLDIQEVSSNGTQESGIDNLINALNKLSERIDKIDNIKSSSKNNEDNITTDKVNKKINIDQEKTQDLMIEKEIKINEKRAKIIADAQEKLINKQIDNDIKLFKQQEKVEQDNIKKRQELIEKSKIDLQINAVNEETEKYKNFYKTGFNQQTGIDFNKIIHEYNDNQAKASKGLQSFGLSMAGIADTTGKVIGDIAQYAKAGNVLIGANLYDRPLREAQKHIQENTAINKMTADVLGGTSGSIIGGLLGGIPGAFIGAEFGSRSGEKIADYFSSKTATNTTFESQLAKQQQVMAGLTGQNLVDFINPETGNKLKTTQDFADIANKKNIDYAMSYQSAQQGILLNNTGTQGIDKYGANNLANEITKKTGNIYTPEQSQQFGSVLSGLFAHSGLNDNSKKQVELLQKILDNASRYGVDPTQYAQEVYKRQQFMGDSPQSAMQYVNMGTVQGWNYANTIQQMERAPVTQRLSTSMALQMVGFHGTYEDLFKKGGISQLEKKAGNLRDIFNPNAMILQNQGLDLWSLKSGASHEQAQENNTKAITENIRALNNLTGAITGKTVSDKSSIDVNSSSAKNDNWLANTIGIHNLNSASNSAKMGNDFLNQMKSQNNDTIGILQQIILFAQKMVHDLSMTKVTH